LISKSILLFFIAFLNLHHKELFVKLAYIKENEQIIQ
jgi:hypothetical protein